ncbi:MAG: hypothetical protein QXD09_05380 [Candidatus Caldarchaeum sp.]
MPTLLTFNSKYVIRSTVPVTTTSSSLVDDTEAIQTFELTEPKTVLVIYQANNVFDAAMPDAGMQNAINIDGSDVANSWDSGQLSDYPVRNATFWVGTLGAGSHTVKGRFASNIGGSTATVSNRVLIVMVFDGNWFYYIDNSTSSTTSSSTFVDDPYAQVTFTPSETCKALVLYNITNSPGATENADGKKAAININGTDYGQAEKSPDYDDYADSIFTAHALSLSAAQTTVKGRFASNRDGYAVTVSRRQLAVLLFADSTLLDISTSTVQVSTTSSSLVDDTEATLQRTITDTREVLVIAVGTKRHGVSSSFYGECYGIKIDDNDRANSRGSPIASAFANSAATAYAEQLSPGSHTIQGRFSNNFGTTTAVISARQFIAIWFLPPPAVVETITAKNFPMLYLAEPATAKELTSKVSGATITKTDMTFPQKLLKSGKAKELRSKWT